MSRLEREGYRVELQELQSLDQRMLSELENVSSLWRGGKPERGFSMAMDDLHSHEQARFALATDGDAPYREHATAVRMLITLG